MRSCESQSRFEGGIYKVSAHSSDCSLMLAGAWAAGLKFPLRFSCWQQSCFPILVRPPQRYICKDLASELSQMKNVFCVRFNSSISHGGRTGLCGITGALRHACLQVSGTIQIEITLSRVDNWAELGLKYCVSSVVDALFKHYHNDGILQTLKQLWDSITRMLAGKAQVISVKLGEMCLKNSLQHAYYMLAKELLLQKILT